MKNWLLAIRPKTLFATVAPVMIGTAMAMGNGSFHLYSFLAALMGGVMIQIGTNLANDYYDFKKGADDEQRLGPTRVTQAGLIKPEKIKSAFILSFAIAILIGIYLVTRGGWPIVIIGLSSILFGILYTGGPYPLGYHGLGDVFVLMFFGPVAVGGTYYVQALSINIEVLIYGLPPGLLSVAILAVNNLRDVNSDREAGKRTLAVRFGIKFTQLEYMFCLLLAAIFPLRSYFIYGTHPYTVLTLLILPFSFTLYKKVKTFPASSELNSVLAKTGQLLFLYALLFSAGWLI